MFTKINLAALKSDVVLESLFTRPESFVKNLADKISKDGYRQDKPILVSSKDVIVDGYTRVAACKIAGVTEIPFTKISAEKESDLVEFALAEQRDRRNLTDADILTCVKTLQDNKVESTRVPSKNEHHYQPIADQIGCSVTKVQHAKELLKSGDQKAFDDVMKGATLHKVTTRTKTKEQDKPSVTQSAFLTMASEFLDKAETASLEAQASTEEVDAIIKTLRKKSGPMPIHAKLGSKKGQEHMNARFAPIRDGYDWFLVGAPKA